MISTIWLDNNPFVVESFHALLQAYTDHIVLVQEAGGLNITWSNHICEMMEAVYTGAITRLQRSWLKKGIDRVPEPCLSLNTVTPVTFYSHLIYIKITSARMF